MNEHEVEKMLKQVKYDLSVTQSRVEEALKAFGRLSLTATAQETVKCATCGTSFRYSSRALAEHVYRQHGGPVPEHYLAGERLAGLLPDESFVPDECDTITPASQGAARALAAKAAREAS